MLCTTFMNNLKLDKHTRIFTGVIKKGTGSTNGTAVLHIELTSLSSEKYEAFTPYHPRKKVVIISKKERVPLKGIPNGYKLTTSLGVILNSLPIGMKIAFTGKVYDPYGRRVKDPLSAKDEDRIFLDNQYLEVIEFNSAVAKKVLKHQKTQEKDRKDFEKRKKKRQGETLPAKLSRRLSSVFPKWFVRGVAIAVAASLIVFMLLKLITPFFE